MIYFIGGVTRSGKSILGRRIASRFSCHYLTIDHLMRAGIAITPDLSADNHDDYFKAQKLEPLIVPFIESLINRQDLDYVLEGVSLTPNAAKAIAGKYPDQIKFCWIGYATISVEEKLQKIRFHQSQTSEWDWLREQDDTFVRQIAAYGIDYSTQLKAECEKHNIPYVETHDFDSLENRIVQQLK